VSQNSATTSTDLEFEGAIAALEVEIADLKIRYDRVTFAQQEQIVLERERNQIKHQGRKDPATLDELAKIQARLDELKLVLESQLVDLWEPFWIGVRFGGLGIALGWAICYFAVK
jgi:hypothetical protein